ncbi:MAG: peptidase S8/S53 subtilisin kexin sedolisin [Elusimicrobia bacterium]|nr:MAG: peptidase S8/S53 subtilisin kexin sedolisin [Elusimicrobiota bacterium]KAF0155628.1 MAG: peptidase S8/S53 subtilisin kexin sedolisin [Elusimicrobiota bacterium]
MIRSLGLAAALLFAFSPAAALEIERHMSVSASGKSRQVEVVKGEVLARFSSATSSGAVRAAARARGGDDGGALALPGWRLLKLPPGMRVADGLGQFKSLPGLEVIQPNHAYRPTRVPNDPFINSQYALSRMSAYAGWEYEVGNSSRVTVAVIDTGIDGTHPELSGKFGATVSQYCNPGPTDAPGDNINCVPQGPSAVCNHGTMVAGLAAAASDNATGIAGISWGAQVVSIKIFRDSDCVNCNPNSCFTDDQAIAHALLSLISKHNTPDYGKVVANLSLGGGGACSALVQSAVTSARTAGILVVAATGNDSSLVNSPANCDYVLPVGATDSEDKLAYFSSRGPEMALRGVSAPGVGVYTTDMGGGYTTADGTSFASPLAAGAAALVWAAKPVYTSTDVANALRNTADDLGASGPDNNFGHGRVNIHRALRYAVEGTLSGFKGESKAIAFPSPFRPASDRILSFSFPADTAGSGLTVEIYTMEGELVKKLDGLTWNGLNAAGNPAATGVYLFMVRSDSGKSRGKFAIIR